MLYFQGHFYYHNKKHFFIFVVLHHTSELFLFLLYHIDINHHSYLLYNSHDVICINIFCSYKYLIFSLLNEDILPFIYLLSLAFFCKMQYLLDSKYSEKEAELLNTNLKKWKNFNERKWKQKSVVLQEVSEILSSHYFIL